MKKLRNPGGIESWFEDDRAAEYLRQPGWSEVEDLAPRELEEAPRPSEDAIEIDAPVVDVPAIEEAPAPVSKSKKGRK